MRVMPTKKIPRQITRAVFPGSFDPFTSGHVDIVQRAIGIFDEVVVGVLSNPDKKTLFTVEERVALVEECFAGLAPRVRATSFSGLLVEFAKSAGATVILRGLRAISDFDYEAQMALMNKNLSHGECETLFLMTSERNSYISSSLVRQVARFGGAVEQLVPVPVVKALEKKFRSKT
jgi:pantetheine-phosphate adenylyltransferase